MWSFLSEFTRNVDEAYTILVMNEDEVDPPRRYKVQPRQIMLAWGGLTLGMVMVAVGLVVFTPLRQWIPGYGTKEIERAARLNAVRVEALSDSLRAQRTYIRHVQGLITGRIDSALVETPEPAETAVGGSVRKQENDVRPTTSEDWQDHAQPALALARLPVRSPRPGPALAARSLSSLQFPARPPVNGFPTRGFDARAGHYAVDVAVEKGTPVRSVGDGYVILADWTQSGGFTIAVQHADGFTSVYKHNKRLLKRVGDRVRSQETIAMSGNSGEITTGPHLHFELWHNGLAQDPSQYFVGW